MAALPSFISGGSFGTREKEARKKLREVQSERIKASRAFKEKTATTAAGRTTELEAQRQRGDIELARERGTITERLAEKGVLGEMRTAQEARPFQTGIAQMQYGEPSELPEQRRAAITGMREETGIAKKKLGLKGRELDIMGERIGLERAYVDYLKGLGTTDAAEPSPVYDPMQNIDEILNIWNTGE